MASRFSSFLSPKCIIKAAYEDGNLGAYAAEPIGTGEVIAVFGGEVMSYAQMTTEWRDYQHLAIQVEEDLFLVSTYPGPGDRLNHSCDPNAWLEGQIVLVARRDIAVGEMVCFDYATCDGSAYDEFDCQCGSAYCRGRITGEDWRNPVLQERYAGHFAPYLQRRIEVLTSEPDAEVCQVA